MITKELWNNLVISYLNTEPIEYFLAIICSIFTIPLDLVLSPFELIAFIIWKVREE